MSEAVARIRIELEDTDPLVWRELDLPMSTTLAALHDIIQVVMDWWDSLRAKKRETIDRLKFTLEGAGRKPVPR